jgi:acyl dehydratase
MSVSPELVDVVFDPLEVYRVGREKVREFAAAVGASEPQHFDVGIARERGFGDIVAPPTFPIVVQEKTLRQLLSHEGSGIDFSRVVHGDQRFEYSRPVVAGDDLIATLRVTKVQSLGGHSMVTAESVMTTPEGEHIVTAVSTLVVRGDEVPA